MVRVSCCWLYAISKYGYPPNLNNMFKALEEISEMGFRYSEIEALGYENLREILESKRSLKEHIESLNLKIINVCPIFHDIISPDEASRKRALKAFSETCELAVYLNSQMVQTDTFIPPLRFISDVPYKDAINFGKIFKVDVDLAFDWRSFWRLLVNSMRKCNWIAEEHGLRFCLEPRVGESVSNTDAMLRLAEAIDSENFGVVLDTGHLHAQKEILPLSVEKLGRLIVYVHASDNDGRDNYHLGIGKGTIDWLGVLKALKKHGFNGYIGLDIGHVPNIEKEYVESKSKLEQLIEEVGL
ncbi:MAG: sugar phosphate isomerase/epimerase [Candidatus Bathyarchaeia archaeon]